MVLRRGRRTNDIQQGTQRLVPDRTGLAVDVLPFGEDAGTRRGLAQLRVGLHDGSLRIAKKDFPARLTQSPSGTWEKSRRPATGTRLTGSGPKLAARVSDAPSPKIQRACSAWAVSACAPSARTPLRRGIMT